MRLSLSPGSANFAWRLGQTSIDLLEAKWESLHFPRGLSQSHGGYGIFLRGPPKNCGIPSDFPLNQQPLSGKNHPCKESPECTAQTCDTCGKSHYTAFPPKKNKAQQPKESEAKDKPLGGKLTGAIQSRVLRVSWGGGLGG